MPRPLRPIDDRLVYHVINRGNNRQPVFFDDGDYAAFLKALADLKARRPFELLRLLPDAQPRPPADPPARDADQPAHAEPAGLAHPALPPPPPHRRPRLAGPVQEPRHPGRRPPPDRPPLHRGQPPPRRLVEPRRRLPLEQLRRPRPRAGPTRCSTRRSPTTTLAKTPAARQRRWSAFVHQTPSDEDLAAIRRSCSTGLPLGAPEWVERLADRLGLDLTIRPRGRPRKTPTG